MPLRRKEVAAAYDSGVPYIRVIDEHEARGSLKRQYKRAVKRAGKVFNVVKAMSLRPAVMTRSIALYLEIMYGTSALTRPQRELLAVVVSHANDCHY